MVFTSSVFLFLFMPVALGLFYVVPARWRTIPILLLSCVFYAWGEPVLVLLILGTSIATYYIGVLVLRLRGGAQRAALIAGAAVVATPLLVMKYGKFLLETLGFHSLADGTDFPLPIGVSFYTFMAIGYLIDLYRHDDKGAPRLLDFAAYLTLFPHLVAGPIVRWRDIGDQLREPRFQASLFGWGAMRVATGLAKKAVLADSLAPIVDEMFATGAPTSGAAAWLAVFLFTLQIYLDFSAYSDIAIGIAAMLGIRFKENFRYPFRARSAREFWQRWHISLGSWFRDYVYIPLGGSRVRRWMVVRNFAIVWALTGLWHGAAWTFVLWGLYFGVLAAGERFVYGDWLARRNRVVQHVYGLGLGYVGWTIFRASSLGQLRDYLEAMFLWRGPTVGPEAWYYLERTWVLSIVALAISFGIGKRLMDKFTREMQPLGAVASATTTYLATAVTAACLIVAISFIITDSYIPFIYFRF